MHHTSCWMTSADLSQKRTNESPYKAVLCVQYSVTIKNEIIIEKEEQGTYEERKKEKKERNKGDF